MNTTIFQAFYFGYFFWFGMSAGCFALLLIHNTIRGAWALPIQRVLEAGTKAFVVMMPLFVVMLFGLPHIFPWAGHIDAADHVLVHKSAYLNQTGMIVRTAATFIIWAFFAWKLLSSIKRQEKTHDAREADYRSSWAAPGIVMFMLTGTMTYTDWVMSRDAHWFSTIFPALLIVGQALGAIAFCILFVTGKGKSEPFASVLTPRLTRDMGNLLLALTMLWAYFTFSQFVIIWSGNLPEETEFIHKRMEGSWSTLATVVLIFQFFAPFLMLLSGRTKRTPVIIRQVAGMVIFARFLDLYWYIAPFGITNTHETGALAPTTLLWYLGAWLVLGGIWLVTFEFFRKQSSALPTYDTRLQLATEGSGHHA